MKICACVCEYNPFHLGHLKHLRYIKENLKADKIIVVMSGNFSQRGEPTVINKFLRAKEAISLGADMVIELPTVFATANAEIFADGAIKIINALGVADGICFGVESGTKEDYISLANALNNESKEFKKILKEKLDYGISLAKAKFETVKELYGKDYNEDLVLTPNNILGLEYVKAILSQNASLGIYPLIRENTHNSLELKKGVTSASSIRNVIKQGKIKKLKRCLPKCVYHDLKPYPFAYDKIAFLKIILTPSSQMANILDCTEGLENRIKALSKDNRTLNQLIDKTTTKRYTSSRIKRIVLSNLLEIDGGLVKASLKDDLYIRILAVKKESKDLISLVSQNAHYPVITRKSDAINLKKTALSCYQKDLLANDIYNLITDENQNENQIIIE